MQQPHLVVVSVPWRQSSLERLLGALTRQSLPPASVTLLLQAYPRPPRLPQGFENRCVVHNFARNTGPAIRWVWAAKNLPPGSTLAVLDDDFVPGPSYLAATCGPIDEGRADAVGWYGVDASWHHYVAERELARPVSLRVVAGGACAMRMSALDGLLEHHLADLLSTTDGGDDLWTSAVMRRNGARMIRPAGRAPLESTEHQNDVRSIRWSRGLDSGKLFFATELLG